MKIKKDVLKEFLKETSLSGLSSVTEVKLDFSETGLGLTAIVNGKAAMVKAQLIPSAFEEYAEIGKVGIINYSELGRIVDTLGEMITITKDGNMLTFKGGRIIEVPLADESLIKDITKIPNLKYDLAFTLNKTVFKEIEQNIGISVNKSDSKIIAFVGENKVLSMKYGTKYKFEDRVAVESITDKFEVKFGEALLEAVHNLTGDLTIQMKSDFPMVISKKTDMYAIKIIVAPKV